MPKTDAEALNDQLTIALRKCASGDKVAFKEVYALTAPKFTSILLNQLQDAEAVRDVMQQAYMSVWRNAGRFDPAKGKAFTWMLVIMRNRGLDHLRRRVRAPETEEVAETLVDPAFRPDEHTQTGDAGRLLARHLAHLPDYVARSIIMNVVEGRSCTEIGQKLDTSPNTVKGWIRRGLKKLRSDMPMSDISAII